MRSRVHAADRPAVERVLVVAHGVTANGGVLPELVRRGASATATRTLQEAAISVRATAFDAILIEAREDPNATALLLQLLRAEALGKPRLVLVIEPGRMAGHAAHLGLADETLSARLEPARIADALRIGMVKEAPEETDAPPAHTSNLPAVVRPARTRILVLPVALPRELVPGGVAQIRRGERPAAVILTEPNADAAISAWMSAAAAAVTPIIDASGALAAKSDIALATLSTYTIADALRRVEPIIARVNALPEPFFRSRDARQLLLARLAVRERGLAAKRDPGERAVVRYMDESAIPNILNHAESLARAGHLERKFFDKLQCCPNCNGARVLAREECSKCRSADIAEEPIIHHLRCGYQGPERDFKQGRDLICPKCRNNLENFSVDYDKPGALILCNGCGHTTGEAEVGFNCLDCTTHFGAELAKTRTFYEYELTDRGREAAFSPPLMGYGEAGDLEPGSIRDRLRRFAAQNRMTKADSAVLFIKLDPDGSVAKKLGEQRFMPAVALFAGVLRELFEQDVEILEQDTSFFVLITGERSDAVQTALPEIRRELEQHLRDNLAARYHVLGPSEIESLL